MVWLLCCACVVYCALLISYSILYLFVAFSAMSENKLFECSECGKKYAYNKDLRRHVTKVHPGKVDFVAPRLRSRKLSAFKCNTCHKNYSLENDLRQHQRREHGERSYKRKLLRCPVCECEVPSGKCLSEHLAVEHEMQLKCEDLNFSSFADFQNWKHEVEKSTHSSYVRNCSSKVAVDNAVSHYYYCHRSGHFTSNGKGIRHLKLQGSNKISAMCPAKMKVIQAEDGTCVVKFVSTHIGHENDLSHLNLSLQEKDSIASDIVRKIPFQAILEKNRESMTDSKLERIHLLTKQDLHNIEKCYNLCSTSVRHQNDGTSVEAWVQEMNSSGSRCVLFYKAQDTRNELHLQLESKDFVLIIMNPAQCEILQKYGTDCICIDGTHGLNAYGFELITLLVLDDMRQGFPCAFLISNRSDSYVLSIFFDCIKTETGKISPKVFMSDLAEPFYNAWVSTMGVPTMRLYCTWHVVRAWQKNIHAKVTDKEKQKEVYNILRALLEERDIAAFNVMLPAALKWLQNDGTSEFADYFRQNYACKAKFWAFCHRLHAGLNTNMHIERMHHTLKYIYLNGKNVKRLDKAIFALMSFIKDKLFDRLIVLTKGKLTSKLKDIRRRHVSSLSIKDNMILKEESGWTVASSNGNEMYFVQENNVQCPCKLKCQKCDTCIHKYTCTCVDSTIKWNMCKHIHGVCQLEVHVKPAANSPSTEPATNSPSTEYTSNEQEQQAILAEISLPGTSKDPVTLAQEKDFMAAELLDLVSGINSVAELNVFKKHIACLKATVATVRNVSEQVTSFKVRDVSLNKNIIPQRRLFATKKKKTSHRSPLPKPGASELQSVAVSLLQERLLADVDEEMQGKCG